MSDAPLGLLGAIHEAIEIAKEEDVSLEEALKVQRRRSSKRLKASTPAVEPTNVIPFRPRVR
jgi:hypothetical protein